MQVGAIHIVAGRPTVTNELLLGALHERGVAASVAPAAGLSARIRSGDVVLGRLDVRPTLDGVEDGARELRRVERAGVRVLNPAPALLACHDKLRTALRLTRLGVPHPATVHLNPRTPLADIALPVVVKPRYGSWGSDVWRCDSSAQLRRCLLRLRSRRWFAQHGALVQELVPPTGFDLRLVVAGGAVIGAIERRAAEGEWRTNVALGGSRRPVAPPPEACSLAIRAAAALGGDFVGVDLLPLPQGGFVVVEANGAVEFTAEYSLPGRDAFEDAAAWVSAAAVGAVDAELAG